MLSLVYAQRNAKEGFFVSAFLSDKCDCRIITNEVVFVFQERRLRLNG